ncbi:LAME_0F19526g1_1 [Lachancea meyersii CBS 8951]|uniref:polynucleotide adenylyltransferase n=1 Tax=Lachancea meyersii CBS 8951 TaxID=1266667 RepID=A0A1G4K1Q3_9SACH|nr:LAME_0F19526g1_1 [Lachancea meyersii CBS 8951]
MDNKKGKISGQKSGRNGTKDSPVKSDAIKENQKRVKRLRKSSLSRAQRSFAVFSKDNGHLNKYENLEMDPIDSGSDSSGNQPKNEKKREHVVLIEDDGTKAPREIDLVEISSSSDSDVDPQQQETPDLESQDPSTTEDHGTANALDENKDYISLSMSESEEDSGDEGKENDVSGTYDYDNYDDEYHNQDSAPSQKQRLNTDFPWILNHDHSKQREIADWLTLEIKDFVAYISPSQEEISLRNSTITKIRSVIKTLWPDSDLHVFGSFATDLYLPGSDIDCVVNSSSGDKENKNCLYSLASFLKRRNLATQVEVIAKARVPIIKFVEPESQIHIDISFERINGLEAAKTIRGWLKQTPGLRELVLIVKQFLTARRLNSVHTGGLGGFSVICLVYAFLQLHPRVLSGDISIEENLGILLIDMFELYGKNFGYDHVALSVQSEGASYIPKQKYPSLQNPRTSFSLAIQDPGDPNNNISRGSFNIRDIKKAFAGAFDLLTNRCFELDAATFKDRVGKSILGNVIKYRGKQRDFKDERNLVVNKAIAENELYHRKRGRIVHTEVFTDVSDPEEEQDIYVVEKPPKKKQKKTKNKKKDSSSKNDKSSGSGKSLVENPSSKNATSSSTKKSVESLMGLDAADDGDDDGYDPLSQTAGSLADDANKPSIAMKSVNAQTRRDYWLSKGQAL